jgi:hypothetical protein
VADLLRGFFIGAWRQETTMSEAGAGVHLRMTSRMLILGITSLGLVGVLTFAVSRAVTSTPTPASTRLPTRPPRPALSPAEEAYMRAMWPIHGDVERSLMRMSLGQILYKTEDLSRAELKTRMEQALVTYRGAETRIRALEPPTSLRNDHEQYLTAVRLFQESAVEAIKMFKDGREDHLLAAYPKSQEGSDKIREVGGKFWPNEFPPN